MTRVSLTSVAASSDMPVAGPAAAGMGLTGTVWTVGVRAFLQRSPWKNIRTKISLSGTVNHSWVYHRNPDSTNMSREGILKVSPTHGSKNNIIIASFTGTRVCRAEEEICSITFLTKEHRQGLLTLCISQWIITWTPEHETGGSASRLRDTARGRNKLHFLFIHSPPSTLPAPVPGICPPPTSSSPFPSCAGGRSPGAAALSLGAGALASPCLHGARWGTSPFCCMPNCRGHPAAMGIHNTSLLRRRKGTAQPLQRHLTQLIFNLC